MVGSISSSPRLVCGGVDSFYCPSLRLTCEGFGLDWKGFESKQTAPEPLDSRALQDVVIPCACRHLADEKNHSLVADWLGISDS